MNDPADLIEIGGPIPWFSVALTITADDFDPAAVTGLLGVQPDRVMDEARRRAIESARPGMRRRPCLWAIGLTPDQAAESDVAAVVGRLLDRLPGPGDAWDRASAVGEVRIFVGLCLDGFNRGFALDAVLLARLAALRLTLDFDIYEQPSADTSP